MSMHLAQIGVETSALLPSAAVIGLDSIPPFRVVSNPQVLHTRPSRHHRSSVDVSSHQPNRLIFMVHSHWGERHSFSVLSCNAYKAVPKVN